MGSHYNGNGRDIHKRGLAVEVKPASSPEGAAKALESAMRTLKRRAVQEGLIRDMRRKEYAETKGELRRKAKQDAIRRTKKRLRTQAQ
ncbi:MAG TPA: 30S ribosomal protein S21 [Hymenobacter sp.]|jgi:ribosomal protein S21